MSCHLSFKVADCAAFCKENGSYGTALPELPSRDLIGLRAACARVPICLVLQNKLTRFIEMNSYGR